MAAAPRLSAGDDPEALHDLRVGLRRLRSTLRAYRPYLRGALKKTLEALDGKIAGPLAFVVPPAVTAGSILALLVLVHRLIGTPELVATIAFPWSLSTLYAIVYNAGLVRARRSAA